MIAPPKNSATANCQPIIIQSTRPSSITKFVLANMKTIEEVKFAPLENKLFAKALAEYEQDELMIPNSDALKTLLKLSSPSCSLIFLREANACTAPDKVNPKISAQKV
jgi:hypothetical protein